MLDLPSISSALHQTRDGLDAAGFRLECEAQGDELVLHILPTPDACAECLVPKPIFIDIVGEELKGQGIEVAGLTIIYPAEQNH